VEIAKKKQKRRKAPNLRWTESQVQAAELFRQGLTFEEVVDAGVTKTMASRVQKALSKDKLPPQWQEGSPQAVLEKTPPDGHHDASTRTRQQPPSAKRPPSSGGPPAAAFETRYRIDTSEPIAIGAIQVLPEDWRITQHGYLLIVDTYYLTKEELGYDGTIGQFMVDVFRFYRQLMQYAWLQEVGPSLIEQPIMEVSDNGRTGEEADHGAGVSEQSGPGDDEEER